MKKAVMYGAGNIGRGFLGQLFSQTGYEVVFIDVNTQIVDKLNADQCYPIKIVSDGENSIINVQNVRAVNGLELERVAREISDADVMATAVGVNILPEIAAPIARGLRERWNNKNMKPLNILICENLLDANHYLKELVQKELEEINYSNFDELIGFVEASIGRMVPVMTAEMQEGNNLLICVEAYDELPVDKDGFKGEIPEIKNLVPFSPFDYYIHRKLFIHNMGHAITAYLGFLKGYEYMWQAIGDVQIREICYLAMLESARALAREHSIDLLEIMNHVQQLIFRFGNRQLGDTIVRVGRDLQRKLSPNDRLIGALNMCIKNGIDPTYISAGIAAALRFKDPILNEVTTLLDINEIEVVLENVCCLKKGTMVWKNIVDNDIITKINMV